MTTLDDILNAIDGVTVMLNDLRSEERKRFSNICERQRDIYRFLGIPDTDDGTRQQPVNHIFKRFHNGRPIDFLRLRDMLATRFVSQVRYAYEWFSLWKVFYELRLLEHTTLTDFARQMFVWYPDAPKMCTADSLGDYRSGYLGETPSTLWDEQAYRDNIRGNQSRSAFSRISLWNQELREILRLSLRNP